MPTIPNDEAERRVKAGQPAYCVSGIVINGPNGPERWAQWFMPPDLSLDPVRAVEDEARLFLWQQRVDGRRGVLLVANVFEVVNGMLRAADGYAVFADDPERPAGQVDLLRPWTPPAGFDGTGERMPFPLASGQPQVLQ